MTIKELAGHSNLATTERYMHLRQVNQDEAVALLALAAKRTEERNVRAGDAASDASASGRNTGEAGAGNRGPEESRNKFEDLDDKNERGVRDLKAFKAYLLTVRSHTYLWRNIMELLAF